jgi:acyl-CoA reductase-like NAD-dependent aldehyde dehydrogenase
MATKTNNTARVLDGTAIDTDRNTNDGTAIPLRRKVTVCRDPATGDLLGECPLNTAEEVHAAVARARQVQPGWAATPVKQRARAILAVRDYIAEHADELAELIARSTGKTRVDAMATEVLPAAVAASYYARNARRLLADRRLRPATVLLANKSSRIVRVPLGVIGIISPWNYPFAIPFSEVVMGLLAGNAVILKTAGETQLVGEALARCIEAAGLPEGLFTLFNLSGPVAGDAFFASGVDKLFFTGSVPVGKKLMARAAETLTPVSLELGGNDAMLVCPDADLERAAAGAVWAGMQNAGQSCGGVERIYVHKEVYDPFVALLAERVRTLRVGADTDHEVEMGALTTSRQVETVRQHVQDALARGAVIWAESEGLETATENFLPAMVLTGVDHTMRVMREETFGPVVGVMKVDTMEQAVELANDSDLGLTASVWSRDRRYARQLARRVRAGAVTINDHLVSHGMPETPWGGFKASGIGRTHGEIGFDEMTEPQCIVDDWLPGARRDMWWHPHGPEVYQGLRGALDLLYARKPGRRWQGLRRLARILPRIFRAG